MRDRQDERYSSRATARTTPRTSQARADTTPIGQSPARQPARRWGPLPILLGVVAGVILCAAILFARAQLVSLPGSTPDPLPAARAICADLTTQSYDHLYTLLAPNLQAKGSAAQFAASQKQLDIIQGDVVACSPAVSAEGGNATVTLSLRRAIAGNLTGQLSLDASQGAWRIAAYDQNV